MNKEILDTWAKLLVALASNHRSEAEDIDALINAIGREVLAPTISHNAKPYNINNLQWEKTMGAKGEFELAKKQDDVDYSNMLADLLSHDGKMVKDGFWIWVFQDGTTVGRKLSKR